MNNLINSTICVSLVDKIMKLAKDHLEQDDEEEQPRKRKAHEMEGIEVCTETKSIILKDEPYVYLPIKNNASDLDSRSEVLATLLSHLDKDFRETG